MKRAIQKYIEDPLAEEIIKANLQEGDKIHVTLGEEGAGLNIEIEKGKKSAKPKKH